jgi:hypothetical protein
MERWTCPACGATAEGTGDEGLWPPHGWETTDGLQLLARCPAHYAAEVCDDAPASEPQRWFPGPV